MGQNLDEFVGSYKPQENDGFEVLTGMYATVINSVVLDVSEKWGERYAAELDVVEVLDGNGAVGRKLWKRYNKNEEGIKDLLDDLFTAGITLDRSGGISGIEAQLPNLSGTKVHIRAWGWTPDKKKDGSALSEAEKKTYQQFSIISEKRVKKLSGSKSAAGLPF